MVEVDEIFRKSGKLRILREKQYDSLAKDIGVPMPSFSKYRGKIRKEEGI